MEEAPGVREAASDVRAALSEGGEPGVLILGEEIPDEGVIAGEFLQPAVGAGKRTVEAGERIFAVSAMKRTPANTNTSALASRALMLSSKESPTKSATSCTAPSV